MGSRYLRQVFGGIGCLGYMKMTSKMILVLSGFFDRFKG